MGRNPRKRPPARTARSGGGGDPDARVWLRENGYRDVAATIEAVMAKWKQAGVATRRNWWQTLAGGAAGKPFRVSGVEFPVLAAAQERQGLPVTPNAIRRNAREVAPPVRTQARWNTRAALARKIQREK